MEDATAARNEETVSWSKEYLDGFILDEAKLRRIVEVFQAFAAKKAFDCQLEFSVKRTDVEYTAPSVEAVLQDENLSTRRIKTVALKMVKRGEPYYSSPLECELQFNREPDYRKSIYISIKDKDRTWAYALTEELDTHVQRTLIRSRKGITSILGSSYLNDFVIPSLVLGICLLAARRLPIATARLGDLAIAHFVLLIFVLLLATFTAFWLGSSISIGRAVANLLKDDSAFYWGDERESYDRRRAFRQNMKWVVAVGFIVSLTAGVMTALFLTR
jgi:hypothetical protein